MPNPTIDELARHECERDGRDVHFAVVLFLVHGGTVADLLHWVANAVEHAADAPTPEASS